MIKSVDVNKAWQDFNDGRISYDHWMSIWNGSQNANFATLECQAPARINAGFGLSDIADTALSLVGNNNLGTIGDIASGIFGKKKGSSMGIVELIVLAIVAGKLLSKVDAPLMSAALSGISNIFGVKKDGSDLFENIAEMIVANKEEQAVEKEKSNLKAELNKAIDDENADKLKNIVMQLVGGLPEVKPAGYGEVTVEDVPAQEKQISEILKSLQDSQLKSMEASAEVMKAGFSQLSDTISKTMEKNMEKISKDLKDEVKKSVEEIKKTTSTKSPSKVSKDDDDELNVKFATVFMKDLSGDLNAIPQLAKNRKAFIDVANRIDRICRQLDRTEYVKNSFTVAPDEYFYKGFYVLRGKRANGDEVAFLFKPFRDAEGNNITLFEKGEEDTMKKLIDEIKAKSKKAFAA